MVQRALAITNSIELLNSSARYLVPASRLFRPVDLLMNCPR